MSAQEKRNLENKLKAAQAEKAEANQAIAAAIAAKTKANANKANANAAKNAAVANRNAARDNRNSIIAEQEIMAGKAREKNRQISELTRNGQNANVQRRLAAEQLEKEKEELAEVRAELEAARKRNGVTRAEMILLREKLSKSEKNVKNAEKAVPFSPTIPKKAVSPTNVNIQISSNSNSNNNKRNNGKSRKNSSPAATSNSPTASTGTKNVAKPVTMRNTSTGKNVIRLPPIGNKAA